LEVVIPEEVELATSLLLLETVLPEVLVFGFAVLELLLSEVLEPTPSLLLLLELKLTEALEL
jgi:hypothetical protein